MKFVMEINNVKIVLTTEQLEAITTALDGCEYLENKYLGNNLGVNGSNYLELLSPVVMRDLLKVGVMSDVDHEAKTFVTKQYNKDKA